MARKSDDITGRVIAAALDLGVSEGWRYVSLAAIAKRAGITLAELRFAFPSKAAIVRRFLRRIDEEVLAGGEGNEESVRDRLFDVLMRRFDALAPHKAAVAAILRDSIGDPLSGAALLPGFMCSMAWMLEAAGLSSAGLGGLARTQGLAMIYANAFRVWLRDESADLGKTMAALDGGLRRAERLVLACRRVPPAAAGRGDMGKEE